MLRQTVIAEHVVAVTLSLYHSLPRFILSARNNSKWIAKSTFDEEMYCTRELRGRRVGVLGYGHIGREIGRMFKALGMDVVVATRSGKKASVGGFLIEGTGDHSGGAFPVHSFSTTRPRLLISVFALLTCRHSLHLV